jgi:acylphosphatase
MHSPVPGIDPNTGVFVLECRGHPVHARDVVMDCLNVVVRGRVQGVGFRYFVADRARTLGLGGWVRNREDGAVEVEAVGQRAALQSLLDQVQQGPRSARVIAVDEAWSRREPATDGFQIRS